MEEQGITPLVVIQPLQVLQDIHRFGPDLLIIDLDLKEISGSDLAEVIAQHRELRHSADDPAVLSSGYGALPDELWTPGASLLAKPVPASYLCWEIKQRLRRARAMRVKLSLLTDNDTVSGLFNRRRFLTLLERAIEPSGCAYSRWRWCSSCWITCARFAIPPGWRLPMK
jgi:PleD family two-component response regulator